MARDDKADVKERLLSAGLKIFAEKGYSGSTFRDICEEAGSNIAAINYYFSDKEGFYCAVREYALSLYRNKMQKCWDLLDTDPWAALKMHIDLMLEKTFDDKMFQVNWFHLRELIDLDQVPKFSITPEMEEQRKEHEARMFKLLSHLLGDSATSKNIVLLRYTYHSLCQFLPIHKQIESRVLRGQGVFNVLSIDNKDDMSEFIFNAVKRTVESMKQDEKNN